MKNLFLFALVACVPARSQPQPTPFTCSVVAPVTPVVRVEGFTERTGDIILTCTGGAPIPAAQAIPTANFTVSLNVPFSSPVIPGSSPCTDAVLLIDEPSNVKLAPVTPSCSNSTGPLISDGTLNVSNGSYPNSYLGTQTNLNAVTFLGVPVLPPVSSGVSRIYRITNVRANPSETHQPAFNNVGKSGSPGFGVNATVSSGATSAGGSVVFNPSEVQVGSALYPFLFSVTPGSALASQAHNPGLLGTNPVLPASPDAKLNVSNLFPGVFRAPATGYQDVPGVIYSTDFGFTSPALPSPFTNSGTLLQAVINNIPAGVSVFVGASATNSVGTVQLTSPGTAAGSTGLTQLPVTNGSAVAQWEVLSANPNATDTFTFPFYAAYQPGVAAPANITVVQSLGSPPGGVSFVQPSPSVPPPILFSINTGASTTPVLSATLDSRPCIFGPIFWSNNACTPEQGLLLNVFSDSASVSLNSPAFTPSGNITEFGGTGQSTPSSSQIFANASNATPGVYPQTITVTGSGGVKPLSLPFTVTVLPANNPIVEVGGFTDAFSYQSGTIVPGQIFTLFGSNFGPASGLVSGTLNASGILGNSVAGTQVLFDNIPAPLLYVANGQLSGEAPFELTGKTSTSVHVISNGLTSPTVTVPVQAASISIASADGSGGNGGVIINPDGALNTAAHPASVGNIVVIYASFAGPFASGFTGTDGRATISAPYPAPAGPVSVTFGGVPATNIPYFANAPGFLEGVLQINVQIPAGVQPGQHVPVVISAGGATSVPWTTIVVQ